MGHSLPAPPPPSERAVWTGITAKVSAKKAEGGGTVVSAEVLHSLSNSIQTTPIRQERLQHNATVIIVYYVLLLIRQDWTGYMQRSEYTIAV